MALFANPLNRASAPSASLAPQPASPFPPIPLHHVPPTPRELRAQAVHRLQVGLFGLAGMLLLVGLANVIMERAQLFDRRTAQAPASSADPSASPSAANDPLVDMGVAPELPAGDVAKKPAKPAGPGR